jgi:O-antigen ligase
LVRLWELPSKVVVYHKLKFSDILFGIGFSALAGTMGNPQYPMAHNNYCDLLFSGGITHFCIFLYLTLRIPVNLFKRKLKQIKIQKFDNMYNVIVFLFLINMGIGASNFFQPVTAVIIFLTLFSYPQIKEE